MFTNDHLGILRASVAVSLEGRGIARPYQPSRNKLDRRNIYSLESLEGLCMLLCAQCESESLTARIPSDDAELNTLEARLWEWDRPHLSFTTASRTCTHAYDARSLVFRGK